MNIVMLVLANVVHCLALQIVSVPKLVYAKVGLVARVLCILSAPAMNIVKVVSVLI